MPVQPSRKLIKKNQRLAAQVGAVNQLHSDRDGTCAYCGTPFPCDTRTVMRSARAVVDTAVGERDEAMAASRAAVAELLDVRAARNCVDAVSNV